MGNAFVTWRTQRAPGRSGIQPALLTGFIGQRAAGSLPSRPSGGPRSGASSWQEGAAPAPKLYERGLAAVWQRLPVSPAVRYAGASSDTAARSRCDLHAIPDLYGRGLGDYHRSRGVGWRR